MLESLQWLNSFFGVPGKALDNEIEECLALITYNLLQWPRTWQSKTTIGILYNVKWLIGALPEELILSFCVFQHFQGRCAKNLHYQGQLFHFGLSGEDWNSRVKLNQDTAKTPHVNASCVRNANDYLGSSVKSRLNIRVNALI